LCTSLLDQPGAQLEGTPMQISTIADTWIHLNYLVHAGERNRGLSIIKSRGTSHSNQVRELILSKKGITLSDVYTAGGEVLMGTMRWEKERAEQAEDEKSEAATRQRQVQLATEEADLEGRLKTLQFELEAKRAAKKALNSQVADRAADQGRKKSQMRELRGKGEA
jgi:circadian clock protein KaiC